MNSADFRTLSDGVTMLYDLPPLDPPPTFLTSTILTLSESSHYPALSKGIRKVDLLHETAAMAGEANPPKKKGKKSGSGAASSTMVDLFEWEKLPDMPTKRCFTAGAYHERKLYVLGTYSKVLQCLIEITI